MSDRAETVRRSFEAWSSGDRAAIEAILADDLTFSSPADVGLDRAGYFERCWPHSGGGQAFDLVRAVEHGDEVVVTYEATRADGSRFRNTEVHGFGPDDRISRIEVYFGWDL